MRTFLPPTQEKSGLSERPTLRTDKPAANYARRSDQKAKDEEKDKSQSREMQTEDMIDWAMQQGWKRKDLYEYFADLGLSGTLRPDQRPDMLRLFDDIDAGRYDHGSVICWQENRLFRDETQIYYNQFIDKCKQHDVVVVVVSPYPMIYDFKDDFYTEMFRWKCKESADFIKRHVKGWMLPARHRAAWIDGEWAGLGDPPTGYIVDFDEHSPTYKKFIPYWPHAEKKREIRELFVELGCDISLLYRRLRTCPIIFPAFEAWVDQRSVNKFRMTPYPGGGYCPKYKSTIVRLLTDPNDIGYRAINGVIRQNSKGEKIIDHEPIIERELFDLCYYPLAKTDLDGNPIEGKKKRRYFRQGSKGEYGLLKFRLRSTQGVVRTHAQGDYDGDTPPNTGIYIIEPTMRETSLRHDAGYTAIACEELDSLIVKRLMEHVRQISEQAGDIEEYEKKAKEVRAERQRKLKQIEVSIKDIDRDQGGLTRSLGKVEIEIAAAEEENDEDTKIRKERRKQLIEEQIDTLEDERQKLLKAKAELEAEVGSDLGSLDEELRKLGEFWPYYSFERRRSLINFVIKEVVIDKISTHWMRVQVLWLHEEWGREEMYYRRNVGGRKEWSEEEIAIMREHYSTLPKPDLMALLPERGWQSIRWCGNTLLHIERQKGRRKGEQKIGDEYTSYTDVLFMQSKGIPITMRYTNWERQYPPSQPAAAQSLDSPYLRPATPIPLVRVH